MIVKNDNLKKRISVRFVAVTVVSMALQACVGSPELKVVANALETSTPSMSERVINLKMQHVGMAESYNQLRSYAIDTHTDLQKQFCAAYEQEALASLYAGEAMVISDLQVQFDIALDGISATVTQGLAGLENEIDRQQLLIERNSASTGAALLPGQYSRLVFVTLVAERNQLQTKGVIDIVSGLQEVLKEARAALNAYVEEQEKEILNIKFQCISTSVLRTDMLVRLGDEAVSNQEQYEIVEQYLVQVAAVSKSINLYVETNSLFGSNGLMRVLISGAVTGLTGGAPQPSSDGAPPKASTLRDSLKEVANSFVGPLKSPFPDFSHDKILRDTDLDAIQSKLESMSREVVERLLGLGKQTVDEAKIAADSTIAGNVGR